MAKDIIEKSMHVYRLMIRAVFATKGEQRIANDSVEHARVLIEELLAHAEHSVDVFCHSLSEDIWGTSSVKEMLAKVVGERPVRLRIVTQLDPAPAIGEFYRSLGASLKTLRNQNIRANFIIVDDRYFRVEPDFAVRKGFAYINKQDWADELVADFSHIYALAV